MISILKSEPFQYALLQAIGGMVLVILATLATWLVADQGVNVLLATLCGGAIPVVKRLMEGIGDHDKVPTERAVPPINQGP